MDVVYGLWQLDPDILYLDGSTPNLKVDMKFWLVVQIHLWMIHVVCLRAAKSMQRWRLWRVLPPKRISGPEYVFKLSILINSARSTVCLLWYYSRIIVENQFQIPYIPVFRTQYQFHKCLSQWWCFFWPIEIYLGNIFLSIHISSLDEDYRINFHDFIDMNNNS